MAFNRCPMCGSLFCQGGCQQNMNAQQIQQDQNYLQALHQAQLDQMRQMMINQSPVKKRVPLPEESILCATGGIVGWRLWRIPCFGDTLLSINGEAWKPREALRAECKKGPTQCQGIHCECGIYAWKNRSNVEENDNSCNCIKGEVWLWGKIIEHAKGYRAEYAYPKAFEKSVDADRVARAYGVKIL